jgi:hypothetical protein
MSHANPISTLAAACVFALLASYAIGATFTFDDIDYWVGAGANHAALVIDWAEGAPEPPALAWGYRWDGVASGRDMLTAIIAADDRLFAKLGGAGANLVSVFGLGYDANDDGQFALDDNTSFDQLGIAITGPADGSASLDLADYYAEGWFTGFWHYGVAASNPYAGGSWSDIHVGMASRMLADGAWDSWTYSPTFNFAAYAANPQPAPSPYPPGDFNHDTVVDAADYELWKIEFGSTSAPDVDASGNGVVDAADYTIWRDNLNTSSGQAAALGIGVPEPSTLGLALCALWQFFILRRKGQRT